MYKGIVDYVKGIVVPTAVYTAVKLGSWRIR